MDHPKTRISTSILAVLGVSTGMMSGVASSASLIADGSYVMTINNTPLSGGTYQFGSNGNWNSSFTMGCLPGTKGCASQAMYDDTAPNTIIGTDTLGQPVTGIYQGAPNDGVAGSIAFDINAGNISATSFTMDTIFSTALADINQYTLPGPGASLMTGFVDLAGQMTFTPTGRYIENFNLLQQQGVTRAWNIDNFNGGTGTGTNFVPNPPTNSTSWQSFTSGQACAVSGCIDGNDVVNVGDVNGDGLDDYTVTLVSAGQVGSVWDTGFFGGEYYEVWASTTTITSVAPVPIPAAIWLFGSGLLGLAGISRRKKAI